MAGRDDRVQVEGPFDLSAVPTGFDAGPAWSPDGAQIAFHGPRADTYDLFVIDAEGSEPVNLTNEEQENWQPAWSADGRRLLYAAGTGPHAYDIWVLDLDSSERRRLTTHEARDEHPSWRPR